MTKNQPFILNEMEISKIPIELLSRFEILFEQIEENFKCRYNELVNIICSKQNGELLAGKISYSNTLSIFKYYFFTKVFNDATKLALLGKSEYYNILDNCLFLMSKNLLLYEIYGNTMTTAFSKVVSDLPCNAPLDDDILTGLVIMLKKDLLCNE